VARRIIVIAVLVVGGAAAFIGYRAYQRHLARLPLEWSGTVEAWTMDIGSRVGGRVKEVLAREGDQVKPGQPLLSLEPGDLQGQRLEAQGQLEQALANQAKVASGGSSSRRQEILAAQSRLQVEQVAIEKAKLDLDRTEKLFAGQASTQNDLDNAKIAMRNAEAQRETQKASLDELLRGTPEDMKSAQGQVDAAQGKLDQIETLIDELTIRAPRDSQVETLDLRPGDILGVNQVAAKLLEPTELFVRIYVPETQLGFIHPHQRLPIFVDSFPGRAFQSEVESISSEGEYTPRNLQTEDERADQVYAARLRIIDGQDVLRAGMAAFARFDRSASSASPQR
jgi:multidrug resistance efflux pump